MRYGPKKKDLRFAGPLEPDCYWGTLAQNAPVQLADFRGSLFKSEQTELLYPILVKVVRHSLKKLPVTRPSLFVLFP